MDSTETNPHPPCLATLPIPALARIIASHLSNQDIARLGQSCHQLHTTLAQPALWQLLCVQRWGKHTSVNTWSTPTHRQLYVQLCQYEHLPGLWQPLGPDAPRCLYAFAWQPDCIQAWTLRPTLPPAPLQATPCMRLDGAPQTTTRLELLDGRIVMMHQDPALHGDASSPHSDAVAAVAINTPGGDAEAVLGSSPAGSFAHEMAQFMRGRVDGRRSRSRRRMARSPSGAMLDAIHHLERLFLSPPAQAGSPLLGMWTAILHGYGPLVLSTRMNEEGAVEGRVVVAPARGSWPRGALLIAGGTDLQLATPAKLVTLSDHMDDIEQALQLDSDDEPHALCMALRDCRHLLHGKARLLLPDAAGLEGLEDALADVWLCRDTLAVVDDGQGEVLVASRLLPRDLPAGAYAEDPCAAVPIRAGAEVVPG